MSTLTGKVAIVTGASRGIGRAIAEVLAQGGASVVVNYAGNETEARKVADAITGYGSKALLVQGDMARISDIKRLFDRAEEHFGKIDIVVSSAARGIFKPHVLVTEAEYDELFALNTRGTFFVLQEAARRVAEGGRIIYISTGGTAMSMPTAGLYAATKAAGEQFALALAKELGPRKVTVNIVSPGVTKTDGLVLPEEAIAQLIAQTPLGRLGEPADIADVVAFLASDAARWMTGQNVRPTGGIL